MVYLRPSTEEIDSWSALGNPGLSWTALLPYYKRSEQLQTPTSPQLANDAYFDPAVHGLAGPVKVGWCSCLNSSGFGSAMNASWQSFGLPWNADPNTGHNAGLTFFPSERDVPLNIRYDAARAYYWPVANRSNLHTFTNSTVLKLDLTSSSRTRATGVQTILSSGQDTILKASKEVVLSAGAYRTPGLLERSGIGNPS